MVMNTEWLTPDYSNHIASAAKRTPDRQQEKRERDLATGPGYLYSLSRGLPLSKVEPFPKGFHGEIPTPAKLP